MINIFFLSKQSDKQTISLNQSDFNLNDKFSFLALYVSSYHSLTCQKGMKIQEKCQLSNTNTSPQENQNIAIYVIKPNRYNAKKENLTTLFT
jgi:hypothetical protein